MSAATPRRLDVGQSRLQSLEPGTEATAISGFVLCVTPHAKWWSALSLSDLLSEQRVVAVAVGDV